MKGQGIVEYALILVLIVIIVIVTIALLGDFVSQDPTAQEIYDQAYSACIAREVFSDSECHEIGLRAIDLEIEKRTGAS